MFDVNVNKNYQDLKAVDSPRTIVNLLKLYVLFLWLSYDNSAILILYFYVIKFLRI